MVHYFRSAIYHLEWAPYKNSDDVRLYACAEGILVVFDAAKPAEGMSKCFNKFIKSVPYI